MTSGVGWTDNVLVAAERMQQLCQAYSMWIVCLGLDDQVRVLPLSQFPLCGSPLGELVGN